MTKRYRMVDCGYPTFKKICRGRKWVGKVCLTSSGYLGKIGNTHYTSKSEDGAFVGVVTKHLGFSTSEPSAPIQAKSREQKGPKAPASQNCGDRGQGPMGNTDAFGGLIMDATFERPKERE